MTMLFDTVYNSVVYGEYNTYYQSCSPIFHQWAVLTSGSFDIIICSILLILFIRPLTKLNREMKMDNIRENVSSRQLTFEISKTKTVTKPTEKSDHGTSDKANHVTSITPYTSDIEIETTTQNQPVSNKKISIEVCEGINNVHINLTPINLSAATISTNGGYHSSGSTMDHTPNSVISNTSFQSNISGESNGIESDDNNMITVCNLDIDEEKEVDIGQIAVPEWNMNVSNTSNKSNSDALPENGTDLQRQYSDPEECIDIEAKRRHDMFIKNRVKRSVLNREQNKLHSVYEELITRYALLVILCIGSSFLLYFGVFFFGHWVAELAPIDDAINVWCIILISKKNNRVYHRLCYSCNYCMKLCCVFRMSVGLEAKVMEIEDVYKNNEENKECDIIQSKSVTSVIVK